VTREKKALQPSQLGEEVSAFLVGNLPKLVEIGFTAEMEEQLDLIEEGKLDWVKMLGAFYEPFSMWVEKSAGPPADSDAVDRILEALKGVAEWAEPVKSGRRVFDDRKFVESIRRQRVEERKAISDRQLKAIAGTLWRYREQVAGGEALLKELGLGLDEQPRPPSESSRRKLDLLASMELSEGERAFVESLGAWVSQGRPLTGAQVRALDRIVQGYAARIENFEAIAPELGLTQSKVEDSVSGPLLGAMGIVVRWREATARGKRVFDDRLFLESLKGQFEKRGWLSPRQQEALKKLVVRYREQIPGFEQLAAAHGLRVTAPGRAGGGGSREGGE
jgi:hypothetical protein